MSRFSQRDDVGHERTRGTPAREGAVLGGTSPHARTGEQMTRADLWRGAHMAVLALTARLVGCGSSAPATSSRGRLPTSASKRLCTAVALTYSPDAASTGLDPDRSAQGPEVTAGLGGSVAVATRNLVRRLAASVPATGIWLYKPSGYKRGESLPKAAMKIVFSPWNSNPSQNSRAIGEDGRPIPHATGILGISTQIRWFAACRSASGSYVDTVDIVPSVDNRRAIGSAVGAICRRS